MTPDRIHDYEYNLRNAVKRLNNDPRIRAQDRRIMLAFMDYIKALGVSIGRQAKYANMFQAASLMIHVPWRNAKRKDIEDLMMKLADHEIGRGHPPKAGKEAAPSTGGIPKADLGRIRELVSDGWELHVKDGEVVMRRSASP